ncbi:MAG: LacI family DNA-binding transcriptional regulator [Akkermansiaceae bacterium]|nr:LacI family DNA-binding transcriptional regulator [Armatimonadota bacterium]
MAVSIYEVATEARVSIATVSRVLNGRPSAQVAPATQKRVREAALRLDYYPSGVARGLARGRMNTIGLVLYYEQPSVTSDPYLGPCLDGILAVHKRDHQNTVLFTKSSWAEALEHLPSFCNGHCDGLLVILPHTDSAIIGALAGLKVPFLLVGDSRDDPDLVCVDVDNVGAGRDAVRYLIGLGHRRIAAFCGNAIFCSSGQRLEGYRQAHEEAGLLYDPSLVRDGSYFPAPGSCDASVRALLDRPLAERPTAIFCFNDNIAIDTLHALRKHGIAVPQEMSVIGFDDVPAATAVHPALTTVRQPIRAIGERAADLLLAQINGAVVPGQKDLLPAQIIVRESTSPPPKLE